MTRLVTGARVAAWPVAGLRGDVHGGRASRWVWGKLSLWRALAQVADQYSATVSVDLDDLIDRAQTQYDQSEGLRFAASQRALRDIDTPL